MSYRDYGVPNHTKLIFLRKIKSCLAPINHGGSWFNIAWIPLQDNAWSLILLLSEAADNLDSVHKPDWASAWATLKLWQMWFWPESSISFLQTSPRRFQYSPAVRDSFPGGQLNSKQTGNASTQQRERVIKRAQLAVSLAKSKNIF